MVDNDLDDYYYNYGKPYVPITRETGPWILIAVGTYSISCILLLPVLVRIGRRRIEARLRNSGYDDGSSIDSNPADKTAEMDKTAEDGEHLMSKESSTLADGDAVRTGKAKIASGECIEVVHGDGIQTQTRRAKKLRPSRSEHSASHKSAYSAISSTGTSLGLGSMMGDMCYSSTRSRGKRSSNISREMAMADYMARLSNANYATSTVSGYSARRKKAPASEMSEQNIAKSVAEAETAAEAEKYHDEQVGEQFKMNLGGRGIAKYYRFLVSMATWDFETKEILKLAAPLIISSVTYEVFDAISTALVSLYLGTEALQAYIVSNLLIGLSDTFIDGVGYALNTVCSHAIGMDNHKLAGQYVQIGGVIYGIFAIPCMGVWWFVMGDCIRLFGMSEAVVEEGVRYTRIVIFHYLVSGIFEGYTVLLEINGQAVPGTIFDIIMSFADMASTWLLLALVDDVDLYWIGLSQFLVALFSLFLFTAISVYKGWLDPFLEGLTKTFALKNTAAVKALLNTAIPLSCSNLISYGEWEALTFFAAALGPKEVAAWGLFEAVWGLMEGASSGATEAGSIRLATHLGRGNVNSAKLCTWKCLFLSTSLGIFETSILFICGNDISTWFTDDKFLQDIMNGMLPVVGIGNILMVFGMVSWSLVGAQGRYKLATTINALVSFALTIPLAAIFCVGMKLTLDALVGAVVIGYSTVGLCLAYVLFVSDWEHISTTIQQLHAVEEESSSDEEEDE